MKFGKYQLNHCGPSSCSNEQQCQDGRRWGPANVWKSRRRLRSWIASRLEFVVLQARYLWILYINFVSIYLIHSCLKVLESSSYATTAWTHTGSRTASFRISSTFNSSAKLQLTRSISTPITSWTKATLPVVFRFGPERISTTLTKSNWLIWANRPVGLWFQSGPFAIIRFALSWCRLPWFPIIKMVAILICDRSRSIRLLRAGNIRWNSAVSLQRWIFKSTRRSDRLSFP